LIRFQSSFFITCLVLASIATPRSYADSESKIVLGGIFDLSGAGKVWGHTELNAFKMAIDDFRSLGSSPNVSYEIEDSQHENNRGISAFQKLTSIDGIKYIVGPTWEIFVATIPLCEAKHIICLAPSHNGIGFQSKGSALKYSFSAYFDERGYAGALAAEVNSKKLAKVGIISANTAYHDTLLNFLRKELVVKPLFSERVNDSELDFRSLILRNPSDIDALIVLVQADQIGPFLRQWAQAGRKNPLIFSDDTLNYLSASESDSLKPLDLKIYCSIPKVAPDADGSWDARYKDRNGQLPQAPNGPIVYDETRLLLSCIAQNPAVDSVRTCLSGTTKYHGASGEISFGGSQTVTTRNFELVRCG
jgi:branched-chain amino acid transport system substrate-binding protein